MLRANAVYMSSAWRATVRIVFIDSNQEREQVLW